MEALLKGERKGVREVHAFSGSNPTQSWRLEMQMYVYASNLRHSHYDTNNISFCTYMHKNQHKLHNEKTKCRFLI